MTAADATPAAPHADNGPAFYGQPANSPDNLRAWCIEFTGSMDPRVYLDAMWLAEVVLGGDADD
jgi:hypothetical protein